MNWSWLKRGEAPSSKPEPACSFCKRSRLAVRHLVACDKAMICDDCIEASIQAIQEHGGGRDPLAIARDRVREVIERLPGDAPFSTSRPLLESWLLLAGGGAAACREAASLALRARNAPAALACIQRIVPSERTFADQLAEAMFHHHNGTFSRALAILDSLDPAKLSAAEQVRFTCRRALARFEAGVVKLSELVELEGELEMERARLRRLGDDEVGAEMRPWLSDLIDSARAWCSLRRGDVADAELRTQARLSQFPNLPEALAFLVRVLEEQGDPSRAEFVRVEALRHAHPESFLAQQLGRTPAPDGGPYR